MKIVKQPWFLILLAVVTIYTYQFYNGRGTITFGSTQAQATEKAKEQNTSEEKESMEVKVSESFPVGKVASLDFASYLPLKIKMNNTSTDNIIVSLIGEGNHYRNDGKNLSDWFDITNRSKVLKIVSPDKKEFKGFSSMKDLAKKVSGNEDRNLTLIVEFPQDFEFSRLGFQVVGADLYADGLKFKKIHVANVSGNIRIKKSVGDFVEVETVSGDSDLEIKGLNKGAFASVSGNTTLHVENQNPEVNFESVSGDLNLEFPMESQVEVKFNSMTGELVNDFGSSKGRAKKVNFSSLSGDAKISKIKKAL